MPELTAIHFGIFALTLCIGVMLGWFFRGDRCAKEKIAVSATWQDQLDSQQSEHSRLAEQNKSLMEQISQYQASQKDFSDRARELSDSLKEAFARRDELQRQMKDIRGKLEIAVAQRNQMRDENTRSQSAAAKEKDDKIFRLSRELTSWQSRVPPLVERFRERDQQARELERQLDTVQTRLHALEDMVRSDHTRIEPVDADSLPHGGDASNEPIAITTMSDAATIQDQITEEGGLDDVFDEDSVAAAAEANASLDDSAFAAVFETSGEANSAHESDVPVSLHDDPDDDDDDDDENNSVNVVAGNGHVPAVAENGADDDLKMIKGIGPSIEKTLHDLGFFRFHQIAEMSEYDIDRVAQQLRGFRSRIYREDWIGQARDLQYQKSDDGI